tara:strand:+ start:1298 stop:1822 length:525 start_codon:yes stop_codon:yes gene_type:complete
MVDSLLGFTLPEDRPVIGMDLELMRTAMGFKVDEAKWVFGLNQVQWRRYTVDELMVPISNPTVALLLRLFSRRPDLIPFPPAADPEKLMEMASLNRRRLSLMLGKDASAANKWLNQGVELSGNVRRLAKLLENAIVEDPAWADEWIGEVDREAQRRGIPDLWHAGGWKKQQNQD